MSKHICPVTSLVMLLRYISIGHFELKGGKNLNLGIKGSTINTKQITLKNAD